MPKIVETRESHKDKELQSRFYRTNQMQCKKAVYDVLNSLELKVVHENERYGEISFLGKKHRGTIEIFTLNPGEYGIDIFMECLTAFDFGKNKKMILAFFEAINKNLTRVR